MGNSIMKNKFSSFQNPAFISLFHSPLGTILTTYSVGGFLYVHKYIYHTYFSVRMKSINSKAY